MVIDVIAVLSMIGLFASWYFFSRRRQGRQVDDTVTPEIIVARDGKKLRVRVGRYTGKDSPASGEYILKDGKKFGDDGTWGAELPWNYSETGQKYIERKNT